MDSPQSSGGEAVETVPAKLIVAVSEFANNSIILIKQEYPEARLAREDVLSWVKPACHVWTTSLDVIRQCTHLRQHVDHHIQVGDLDGTNAVHLQALLVRYDRLC
jgi:hypothetical protein